MAPEPDLTHGAIGSGCAELGALVLFGITISWQRAMKSSADFTCAAASQQGEVVMMVAEVDRS